jgi:hypothetical protein
MEVKSDLETNVYLYRTTMCHVLEYYTLHILHCEHLKLHGVGAVTWQIKELLDFLGHGGRQDVSGGKVNILGRQSVGHSKQKSIYVHLSSSEQFPRQSYFTVRHTPCPRKSCKVH